MQKMTFGIHNKVLRMNNLRLACGKLITIFGYNCKVSLRIGQKEVCASQKRNAVFQLKAELNTF